MSYPDCYNGFICFCSLPIPSSPFPRGTPMSEGFSSFDQLLEFILSTGEVPNPPCVSLTPTLQPPELVEAYERSYGGTPRLLDSSTSLMLSQLGKRGEDQFFESQAGKKLSSPILKRRPLHSQSVGGEGELEEYLAVSLRLNSPPALQAVLQESELDLDKPLLLSPEPGLEGETVDTSVPPHPRLTALGLSALFSQGSPVCVRTLLVAGASVNSRDSEGRTALHWAVLVRDKKTLRLLLKNGADTLCQDKRGDTPIHLCARVGDQKLLALLLNHTPPKTSLDVHNKLEHTPLFEAASMGHFPCVRLLLRASADPTVPGPLRRTALHAACLSGSAESVQQLLRSQSKALLSAKDSMGATALLYAAAVGRGDIIQTLQGKGASLYAQDRDGLNMVHYLALSPSLTEPITALFLEDPKIRPRPDFSPLYHIPSNSGVTPLHLAALSGEVSLVRELLKQKCSLDAVDSHLRSPLAYAALTGRVEVVKLLSTVSAALLNSSDLSQHALLHYATATGNVPLTQFFLASPLSSQFINHQNEQGHTPLHLAVLHTHLPCIQLLLAEMELDIDVPDVTTWTPLHHAVSQGEREAVLLLLQRGARFDSKHFTAIHAIESALHNDHIDVLETVFSHGYSPNSLPPDGPSLLHTAVLLGSLPLTRLLLSYGAAIDSTHHGFSPLDLSLQTQQPAITSFLAQLGASTKGGAQHRAASLIQLRFRFLNLRKLGSWLRPLQSRARGSLVRLHFSRLCRLRGFRRQRAAAVLQRHWRLYRSKRSRYDVSYDMMKARLQAEKAAYALILKKIKEREREAKQAAASIKLLRPVRSISKLRRQKLTSTSLPTIPPLPPVSASPSKPPLRVKATPPLPSPPPQVDCYLDQYKSLTDRYQTLRSRLSTDRGDPLLLRQHLKEALNQAIVLRSDADRLTLPLLKSDPTRPTYHLSL